MIVPNHSFFVKEAWQMQQPVPCSMLLNRCPLFEDADRQETLNLLPPLSPEARIIDLASGIGRFTEVFAKQAAHLTSVEFVAKFLATNRQSHSSYKNIDYILADAMDVIFAPNSAEFIFVNWLFLYLRDDDVLLLVERIASWLSKGGKVFFRETCSPQRIDPTLYKVSCYRPRSFYEQLFLQYFSLCQTGYFMSWLEHANQAFSCYWLMEKT